MSSDKRTWSVLVFDMAHTGEPDAERLVHGFETLEKARAYAEARVRASVEELRNRDAAPDEIRRLWYLYGEDCAVIGDGQGFSAALDLYIALPASPSECDWYALTPRPRRFRATVLIDDGAGESVWAGGVVHRYRSPSGPTLLALFAADARDAFARRGIPNAQPTGIHVANCFELGDPPRPVRDDLRPLRRWRVAIDFVCHDVKFGSSARGVFEWPDEPEGNVLGDMQRVLMGDMLALRGSGPDMADYSDVLTSTVEATDDAPDYPLEPQETAIPGG